MRLLFVLAVLLVAASVHAGKPSKRHAAKLTKILVGQFKEATIKTFETERAGLTVVAAAVEGAYPGTGVLRVVVDGKDVSYGAHGDKGFADLVRKLGWLDKPPPADDLLAMLNDAVYEGIVVLEAKGELASGPAGLSLPFDLIVPGPGNPEPTPMKLAVPRAGKEVIEKR